MQICTTITLAYIAISFAYAGCFHGGQTVNPQAAYDNLVTMCTTLQGTYYSQQWRSACLTSGGNQWFFVVKRISSTNGVLNMANCTSGLYKEISACQYGGEQSYTDWYYKADPNRGACIDNGYINGQGGSATTIAAKRDANVPAATAVPGDVVRREEVEIYYDAGDDSIEKRGTEAVNEIDDSKRPSRKRSAHVVA